MSKTLISRSILIAAAFAVGCSGGGGGLSPEKAKVHLLGSAEYQYEQLVKTVEEGAVPVDAGRLPREVSAVHGLLSMENQDLGAKLQTQVDELEAILEKARGNKSAYDKVKEKLDEIGQTMTEIKATES